MINEHTREQAAKELRRLADQVDNGEIETVVFATSARVDGNNLDEMGVYQITDDDENPGDNNRLIGLMMRLKRNLLRVYS